jgi:hypothetical protein
LLSNELGVKLSGDPYDLRKLVLPDVITTKYRQRDYVKLLVLMGINADSDKKAYQAFRNNDRKDKIGQPYGLTISETAKRLYRQAPTVRWCSQYRPSPQVDEYRQSDCQHGVGSLYE